MMTRETKIGLLVGLAFILVIGILLSEHVTTASEAPVAALGTAGKAVRQSLEAPQEPARPAPTLTREPRPAEAVQTQESLTPPEQKLVFVTPQPRGMLDLPVGQDETPKVTRLPQPLQPDRGDALTPLEKLAQAQGEGLVPIVPNQAMRRNVEKSATPTAVREYVARSGDSLGRIASRLLGANTLANRQAIVDLNPSLQKDPNRIIVGAKYTIPADAWTAAMGDSAEAAADVRDPEPKADKKAPKPADKLRTYTVQPGDSLWKIATAQCGNADAVEQIRQLNPDLLGDGNVVHVNMVLKLPAK